MFELYNLELSKIHFGLLSLRFPTAFQITKFETYFGYIEIKRKISPLNNWTISPLLYFLWYIS